MIAAGRGSILRTIRENIRAWDAITGKLVWNFHVIPQPGEPNHEDWTGDTWQDRSGANTFAIACRTVVWWRPW